MKPLIIFVIIYLSVSLFQGLANSTEPDLKELIKIEQSLKSIAMSLTELTDLYKESIEDAFTDKIMEELEDLDCENIENKKTR